MNRIASRNGDSQQPSNVYEISMNWESKFILRCDVSHIHCFDLISFFPFFMCLVENHFAAVRLTFFLLSNIKLQQCSSDRHDANRCLHRLYTNEAIDLLPIPHWLLAAENTNQVNHSKNMFFVCRAIVYGPIAHDLCNSNSSCR